MDKRGTLHIFIFLTVISILLIAVNTLPFVRVIKNTVIKIIYPVNDIIEYPVSKSSSIYNRSKMFFNVYDENVMLKSEIDRLKMNYADIEYIKSENKRLENLLGFSETDIGKLIPAKVLIQSTDNYFLEFIINKGKIHGVKNDFPVITIMDSKWVLLGRIGEVFEDFSKVVLITSYDFRCGAVINNGYRGVIKGDNGWMLKMEYISPDANITKGDKIYTSGTGGIFPPGFLIGSIADIKTLRFSTGKKAVVKGAYYPQNAENIYVVERNNEK